jgi:hypothetical protein
MPYSYAEAISTLQTQGYPVDGNGEWGPVCQNSWFYYIRSTAYATGTNIPDAQAAYGFAYQGAVNPNFATAVSSGKGFALQPSASPRQGSSYTSYNWQFTANESGGQATAFNWNYGDGTTGTGNPSYHTYTAPGQYTPFVNATFYGSSVGPFYASQITVI